MIRALLAASLSLCFLVASGARADEDPEPDADTDRRPRYQCEDDSTRLLDFFSIDRSDDVTRMRILQVLFVELFGMCDAGEDEFQLRIVDMPFVTLWERNVDHGFREMEAIGVPFIKLFRRESEQDGTSLTDVLRLPLIGSLYRSERTPDSRRQQILFFIRLRSEHTPQAPGADPDPEPN
jgi:hypothetical protein